MSQASARGGWIIAAVGLVVLVIALTRVHESPGEVALAHGATAAVVGNVPESPSSGVGAISETTLVESAGFGPGTTPSAKARFDPSAWPPLPGPDASVAAHLDALKSRARRGDHGAACWVGNAVSACVQTQSMDRTMTEWHRRWRAREAESSEAKRLEHLVREETRLAMLQRCQGITPAASADILPMLHQAALGGSKLAIGQLVSGDPFTLVAGFPDGAQLRSVLDDADALWWAGLEGGVPGALEATLYRFPRFSLGAAVTPRRDPPRPDQLGALAYVAHALLVHQEHRHGSGLPESDSVPMVEWDGVSLVEPDPATKRRLDGLADAWDAGGWSEDLKWYEASSLESGADLSQACTAFTNPVDRTADPWQALLP